MPIRQDNGILSIKTGVKINGSNPPPPQTVSKTTFSAESTEQCRYKSQRQGALCRTAAPIWTTFSTIACSNGSPGDPLGDLLFNMIMRLIMEDCRDWFQQHTQAVWMGTPDCCASFASAPDLPAAGFVDLAFVDDAAIALHAPSLLQAPPRCPPQSTQMCCRLRRTCQHSSSNQKRGLTKGMGVCPIAA